METREQRYNDQMERLLKEKELLVADSKKPFVKYTREQLELELLVAKNEINELEVCLLREKRHFEIETEILLECIPPERKEVVYSEDNAMVLDALFAYQLDDDSYVCVLEDPSRFVPRPLPDHPSFELD
jgi:hypothetical protein